VQVAPLLFPKAGLVGTLIEFGDASEDGIEKVGGRPCHKLVGVAQDQYGATGKVVNVRKTIVWIDVETLLIRKVSEEPRDTPPGRVNRTTTTFEPHANPALDDAKFRFTVPGGQH
jgi:outer membrane lipoprotein-sorting protein